MQKKYDNAASRYYRRMICAEAKKLPLTETPPFKNFEEAANRAVDKTNAFFVETDEKYKVTDKAAHAAEVTK